MKKNNKKTLFVCLCMAISLMMTGCVDQSQGNTDAHSSDELRIVSTSVSICEILDQLEVDEVVGIPETTTYTIPDRYAQVTTVGAAMTPDMEILSSLKPTLILSPVSLENDLAIQYENVSVDSVFLNLNSVEGMFKSIEELGPIVGKEEEANALVDEFKEYMQDYYANTQEKEAPTVLILMGLPGSYVVATENSYVGNLVALAGGINVYEDENEDGFINVNTEDMVERHPDIILRTSHAMPEQVQQMFDEEFATNDIWKHFDAVNNNRVYDLDNGKFGMSAKLNYQEALEELQEIFYGEE